MAKTTADPEVHDGPIPSASKRERELPVDGNAPIWKALSVVLAMLAVAYDVSPVDAVPDAVPVLGWLDDVGFTVMAALNVYQQFAKDQTSMLVRLVKYVKWMLVALILLAGVAIGGLVTAIMALVTR